MKYQGFPSPFSFQMQPSDWLNLSPLWLIGIISLRCILIPFFS